MGIGGSQRLRRPPRRWVVPPGLRQTDEPFDGYAVLDELRGPLGMLLWQSLRDVDLWSAADPDGRVRLFAADAASRRRVQINALPEAAPVRGPLLAITRVLEGNSLGDAELSTACLQLSRWAIGEAHPRTALTFGVAAAVAAPQDASAAYWVATLSRRAADYRRAETWYRRAIGLARRTEDWKSYGQAYCGWANLFIQRGDYPSARDKLMVALRAARRHGLWSIKPMALHDLCCMAITAGNTDEAVAYGRKAFRAYGRRHPRVVALAHDIAFHWMLQGYFAPAMRVFRAVLGHVTDRPHRLLALSSLARAAGGVGDRFTYTEAWTDTWRLIDAGEETEKVAETLVNLAHGAASIGDRERATIAAGQALTVAVQRGEAEQRIAAETLLDALRRTGSAGAYARPATAPTTLAADALSTEFAEVLTLGVFDV
jgi:tetratricopeptide (TPR) repeat protein